MAVKQTASEVIAPHLEFERLAGALLLRCHRLTLFARL